jgi:hypothetical protein
LDIEPRFAVYTDTLSPQTNNQFYCSGFVQHEMA